MIPAAAIARKRGLALEHDTWQNPVGLQLAGCDPIELARTAKHGAEIGFTEINLNCGCPSSRAAAGGFGACLMTQPDHVARCVSALCGACAVPITVKCRLAIDDLKPQDCLHDFAKAVRDAGAAALIVHARKAWLAGLNPKQNRQRPPLEPARVTELKHAFPDLEIITNGGIDSLFTAAARLTGVDGVMIGRAVVAQPQLLAVFARAWFQTPPPPLAQVLDEHLGYCDTQLRAGTHPRQLFTPLSALAYGRANGRTFRRMVSRAAQGHACLNEVRNAWT